MKFDKQDISDILISNNVSNNYIEHHGILGQKWGVRRFQNADGSYTAAGRDRYGIGDEHILRESDLNKLTRKERRIEKKTAKIAKRYQKELIHREKALKEFRKNPNKYLKDPKWIKKNQHLLSDNEIKSALTRMQLLDNVRIEHRRKLNNVKQYIDLALGYGDTLNNTLNFINSPAGKTIRQLVGLSTKNIGFSDNKNYPRDPGIQRPGQQQQQSQQQKMNNQQTPTK